MASTRNTAVATSGNNVQLANVIRDVYSKEIAFAAQPLLMHESVVTVKEELGKNAGDKIRFLRYATLTGPSAITENVTVETETLSTSYREIGTTEHIRALGFSEKLLLTSMHELLGDAAKALGMNYARNRDMNIRDAAFYGGVPDLATSENPPFSTTLYGGDATARTGLDSADTFSMALVRNAVETLATNKTPKLDGSYICFLTPHQAKGIRSDDDWISVAQYADPSRIFNGEIGRIEDVRFIETTMCQVIKQAANTVDHPVWTDNAAEWTSRTDSTAKVIDDPLGNDSVDVHRALICGAGAFGVASILPVQMRDNGVIDFGRTRNLAYYAIYGTGIVEETFGAILETA